MKQKSFQGFDFDDFMNVSGRKSDSVTSQPKKQKEPNNQ